ncbi:hypothetical protein BX666DRAFT_1973742 [Dichotomocladium elegans]|nr:hypothetical protein BX666DRAFT_1973742 [Dichotomocladium elegans]
MWFFSPLCTFLEHATNAIQHHTLLLQQNFNYILKRNIFCLILSIRTKNTPAYIVEWYNFCLPSRRSGFDSPCTQ